MDKLTGEKLPGAVFKVFRADNNQEVIDQEAYLSGKGFSVIGVGIQSNAVRHSFREHIVVNDISSFAVELGKLTKGKLDRMLVRHDA